MANNGQFDPVASWAKLSERVENQGKDIVDLRSNMNSGFQSINANLTALSNELRAGGKTQWPVIWSAIGVSFAIIVAIGGLAYAPITAATGRLESALAAMSERMITREELEWRSARAAEDRGRQETAISDLRASTVTRPEWTERNRARDQEVSDISRRVDEIRADFGSVYGTRDVIQQMQQEIDRLRQWRLTADRSPP